MAISRARKEELVQQYTELLNESNGFVIVHSTGLTVKQVQALRAVIRETSGQLVRTKNTLLKRALDESGWVVPEELLAGPVGVAFSRNNFPGVAKAVLKYIKDENLTEKLQVVGGLMGESILDVSSVQTMSELPTLDELRSQLAGLIVAPAQGIVSVIQAANGQIVNVLQAYLDDRGEGDEGEAA